MEYGVFAIRNNVLEFVARYATRNEAIAQARSGSNMVVLEIYL